MLLIPSLRKKNRLINTSEDDTQRGFPLSWGEWFNFKIKDNSIQTRDTMENDYYLYV